MAVVEAQYGGIAGTALVSISGTIAEVLQELADKGINATRVMWYLDDDVDAEATYCKQH